MEAAGRGEMQAAVCLGGNLFGSNPDAAFAARALQQLDLIAYLSTTLNTGHAWGTAKQTLILPVLPRDEEPQPTTQESMFSYIRLSDGGPPRHQGPRSEVSVLCALAKRVLGDPLTANVAAGVSRTPTWSDLESHQRVRALIADLIPGLEPLGAIDRTKREFHIEGRRLDAPAFDTRSGKAQFHALDLPNLNGSSHDMGSSGGRRLRLMTVRSEGQFNTVVYEDEDAYRGQERRDVVLVNAADIERWGLKADQRVTVRSKAGELRRQRLRPFDIRPGNALMYYPEANVLVPRAVDPRSKTPAFKSVEVELVPELL
jgi:anaerobic selenocysteine-containing dehydrogenase